MKLENSDQTFRYSRRVAYYETDAMGVVHHSNYVRFFEDARVDWMRASGLMQFHAPQGPFVFAVHELSVEYKRPLKFDDEFEIALTVHIDGIRLRFAYEMSLKSVPIASGKTVIIPVDAQFKPSRLPAAALACFKIVPRA